MSLMATVSCLSKVKEVMYVACMLLFGRSTECVKLYRIIINGLLLIALFFMHCQSLCE